MLAFAFGCNVTIEIIDIYYFYECNSITQAIQPKTMTNLDYYEEADCTVHYQAQSLMIQ